MKNSDRARLVIDGRKAQGTRTGIGHYTQQLLLNWPDQDALVLYCSGDEQDAWNGAARFWKPGSTWHLRAAVLAIKQRARYFSPESMFVPMILGHRATITIHDLSPLSHSETHTRWNVFLHKTIFRFAVRRVGKIIVPTNAVKRDLIEFEPSVITKTHTVYEGIRAHEEVVDIGSRRTRPYALYVGTVEPRKNVTDLILRFIEEAPPSWDLIIVGKMGWLDQRQRAEFQEAVDSDSRVSYRGYVDDNELLTLYRDASSFFYVSSSEGFGLPIAEAMSFGLPVVHTNDPALAEVGGGAGIIVDLENFDETLRSAIRLTTSLSPQEFEQIGRKAKRQSKQFDWSAAARVTKSLAETD